MPMSQGSLDSQKLAFYRFDDSEVTMFPIFSPFGQDGSLKLTHGTGDDNVHFQNTLRLVDALQRKGVLFDLMIYPDGMHGYRGAQHEHDALDVASFWKSRLLDDKF